jgi:preprotein translocase subunit Sec61beta
MANDSRIRLPSSGAGITNYSDEYKSRFMISPVGVIVFVAVIVVFSIVLHLL